MTQLNRTGSTSGAFMVHLGRQVQPVVEECRQKESLTTGSGYRTTDPGVYLFP